MGSYVYHIIYSRVEGDELVTGSHLEEDDQVDIILACLITTLLGPAVAPQRQAKTFLLLARAAVGINSADEHVFHHAVKDGVKPTVGTAHCSFGVIYDSPCR